MANKKISQLNSATPLQGDESIVVVQGGETKKSTMHNIKNYIVAVHLTAEADVDVDLGTYENARMFKFSWTGDNGTAVYTLPDATTNQNRLIRFIADSTFTSSKHVDITPMNGQTLDGGASSNRYRINKDYEGIAIWSDGTEWFIIQKKA
jgi:hypothetical protein